MASINVCLNFLDGDHPEEQGLKPPGPKGGKMTPELDGDHPEEQGLKLVKKFTRVSGKIHLDGDHPEEQGLKLTSADNDDMAVAFLMGIIQKNKD